MMLCYLAVPARIVGIDTAKRRSRRDNLSATVVGGAVGAVVCSPPYMIGRLGILMLGWHYLFWVGIALDRHRSRPADRCDERSQGGQVLGQTRR